MKKMEVDTDLELHVMSALKFADERQDPPAARAAEVARVAQAKGLGFPSPELGLVLVGNLCFANNTAAFWKLLEHSIAHRLVAPLHALALLTARVVPHRTAQPEAYRLYLELLNRYIFASPPMGTGSCREKIRISIDNVLQLSHTYGIHKMDFGHTVLLFHFSVILRLLDATLEDWGLQLKFTDKNGSISSNESRRAMDLDANRNSTIKQNDLNGQLCTANALLSLKVVEKVTASKEAKTFLRLIQLNLPEKFNSLLQRLKFIEVHKSTSQNLLFANEILVRLCANIQNATNREYQLDKHHLTGVLLNVGSCGSTFHHNSGADRTACWISIDIFMENAMDEKHVHTGSAIEILTELTKTLRVINQATWQETFQALWVSALRLVQRDREPLEGPVPHLDARLCMLLSIVPLTILRVVKEEEEVLSATNNDAFSNKTGGPEHVMTGNMQGSRRHGLVLSLQLLGKFSSLLSPPSSVVIAANIAAAKAATFISNIKKGNDSLDGDNHSTTSTKAVGNMLHLIVEACIARKLVDTSAYFWPSYVDTFASPADSKSVQESPWSTFMKGASLTSSLRNALTATPFSSITELERLYHIALHGSEEEKSAAAKILCGASLIRGWNIQEHTVQVVIRLLSPPVPTGYSADGGHLISYKSMLNSVLLGLSCADVIHILSLYGMIPEVAAALMPLCETFGSLSPSSDRHSSTSSEGSAYSVFSCAFLFLLRLWKFFGPPHEHCLAGRGGTVKMQLTLNYLLLIHNSRVSLQNCTALDGTLKITDPSSASSGQPVCIDSFPKLRAWYFQNQACIASTLSGLSSKSPVHQVANEILNMIYQKMIKGGTTSENTSGSSSTPHINTIEDAQRPMLPAWEVLEAIPFVLEAVLSACAHGKLSSRDLTTGLRDLVDFLPASLATIISYLSAETTRGIWKPVLMNGIDWPSPALNLVSFESEVEEILKTVGVHLPGTYAAPTGGTKLAMLPLPIAALVSLTITFKVDKSLEYVHGVAGQALESSAIGCLWPSMPIIGALWSQKVRRWHDFIVVMCARSFFTQDKEAVAQLTRSCFSSFIGTSVLDFHQMAQRGVSGLLGQAFTEHRIRVPISPGTLYLRSCRTFHDAHFVSDLILRLVVEQAREPANSFAVAAERARAAAILGASLLCIAGGVQVVQVLYEETLPTYLLSGKEGEGVVATKYESHVLGGYGMACMVLFCGALVWGVGKVSPAYSSIFYSKRNRVVGAHVDFLAGVVEGKVPPMCDTAMLRAYVLCLVSLMVRFVPGWVSDVKPETLKRLASGLRGWGEGDLALALLEGGGSTTLEFVVESLV